MPSRSSDFEMTANEAGVITFSDSVSLPISVKITEVFFETADHCLNRVHKAVINVDGTEILTFDAVDCEQFSQKVQIKLSRGAHTIQVIQNGYDPQELVKGKIGIEYQISFF